MHFKDFLSIVELRTKVVSVSSLLIGGLTGLKLALAGTAVTPLVAVNAGASTGQFFGPIAYAIMFLSALAVDMGTTAFNTFFDYWNGTDKKATNRESDKILVHRGVPPGHALVTALSLYVFAVATGILLAAMTSWWILPVGAVCMLVGFFYTAGPRPIASTPLGEIFAGGFLGFVLIELTAFVCTGTISAAALWAGLPSSIFIASILTVNNTNDIQGDTLAGRKTLSILIGIDASRILVPILAAAAYLAAAYVLLARTSHSFSGLPSWFDVLRLAPLLVTLLLSLKHYRAMFKRGFSHATKGPNMGAVSKSFVLFSIGFLLGMVA